MPEAVAAAGIPLPLVLAVGILARVLGIVTGAGVALPEVSVRIRLALAVAVTGVALPLAVATQRLEAVVPGIGTGGLLLMCGGEALVGLALGAAVAAVASAGAWAGGVLGSVAGLSWADDFDPEGDAQSAGMARFAWWVSAGVFLAAGGLETLVAGVVDSVRVLPIGTILPVAGMPRPGLEGIAADLPAVAFSLALAVAVPALLAVVGFHLVTAIALRTVPFVAGAGFLQALAAVVLLGAIYVGADAWAQGFPTLVQGPIEQIFTAR
ncbi:MAG: flagellar biosynthetic protein FliR [Planctomycetia bacterium]